MKSLLVLAAVFLLKAATISADDTPRYKIDCIELNGTIKLNISYTVQDGTAEYVGVTVPSDAAATGSCEVNKTYLALTDSTTGNVLTLHFDINPSKNKMNSIDAEHWGVTTISYDYKITEVDAKSQGSRQAVAVGSYFNTPINKTYSCSVEAVTLQNVTLAPGVNGTLLKSEHVTLDNTALRITVGDISPKTDYDYHYCKADQKVKDIVPIAVGVALAALVIIVLVAYLIGRRRTVAAGGYERV